MSGPTVAVGAIVFRNHKILLVKRKNEPAAGKWAIPGGKVKQGESLKDAAEREILEETSIRIEAGKLVDIFELIASYHYLIVDLEGHYIAGEPRPGDDALEACWISATDLKQIDVTESTRNLLKEKYKFG